MKKHWYILAVMTTVIFTSCNKDEEITEETNELKVLEYCPAPGQFINEGFNCQTMQEANAYALERLQQHKLDLEAGLADQVERPF